MAAILSTCSSGSKLTICALSLGAGISAKKDKKRV